jgi:hypothetical protein
MSDKAKTAFEYAGLLFGVILIVSALLLIAGNINAAYVTLASGVAFFTIAFLLTAVKGEDHDNAERRA